MTTYRVVGPQRDGDYYVLRNGKLVAFYDTAQEAVSEVYRLQAGEKVRKAVAIWKELNHIDVVIEE